MKNLIFILLIVSSLSAQRIMPGFVYDFAESSPIKYGVQKNQYIAWHIIGGGVMARIVNSETIMGWLHLVPVPAGKTLLGVFTIAVGWEVLEYWVEGKSPYSSPEHYFWDTTGDVIGAVIGGFLAVRWNLHKHISFYNNQLQIGWSLS